MQIDAGNMFHLIKYGHTILNNLLLIIPGNIPPIGHAIKQGLIFTPPEAGVQDQKKLKIEEEVDHKMEELVLMASIYWK